MKALLAQLGANGDCLYATVLARQIKHDLPDCHLTWAISSQCKHLLVNNPHVDEVWEWNITDWSAHNAAWYALERALSRVQMTSDRYDRVVASQIIPANIRHYDGTVRPSILRAYGADITVPIDSVIELTEAEQDNVEQFARTHNLQDYSQCVLFECSSKSGQSFVTPQYAIEVAREVTAKIPNCCFILSTHEQINTDVPNVISAQSLTMRENAALTHYCSLFVGCGSGLTVVATSSAAKDLPSIQLLKGGKSVYASFFHDFAYFGKSTDRFIEMPDAAIADVSRAIVSLYESGVAATRAEFHRPLDVFFDDYLERVEKWAIRTGRYIDAVESLHVTVERYGWTDQLRVFCNKRLKRLFVKDPIMMDPRTHAVATSRFEQLIETSLR